jgi:hypothetical protein
VEVVVEEEEVQRGALRSARRAHNALLPTNNKVNLEALLPTNLARMSWEDFLWLALVTPQSPLAMPHRPPCGPQGSPAWRLRRRGNEGYAHQGERKIHMCHMRRRIHVSYEEEDTCVLSLCQSKM